jgi:hypothetical protein
MTEYKKTTIKKLIFPLGIFILIFLAESIIGIAGVMAYSYFSGKKNIRDIETYTVNYSKTMAEAFARVAEFSFTSKTYSSLNTLFHEKIEENTIDEAFFVLADGKLIVHSNTTIEKELDGNIAVDEMAYNLDMILKPVQTRSTDLILNNYNIVDKKIPFRKQDRNLLKKYIYRDIDSTGWLFTRGVFVKGNPVGSVNFIISKDRIYSSIQGSIKQARYYSMIVLAVSIILSFFISLIVLVRYRSIQKNAIDSLASPLSEPGEKIQAGEPVIQKPIEDELETLPEGSDITVREIDLSTSDEFDAVVIPVDEFPEPEKIHHFEDEAAPVASIKKHRITPDEDESITVELLGEIEPEQEFSFNEEVFKKPGKFIAPVINLEDYKNSINKEIRDAIPVRKKR